MTAEELRQKNWLRGVVEFEEGRGGGGVIVGGGGGETGTEGWAVAEASGEIHRRTCS